MLAVIVPLKDHIVNARAHDADRHADNQAVDQVVRGEAERFDAGVDIQRGKDEADADDRAIPVDIITENIGGNAVDREFQAERRESNDMFHG